MSDSSRIDCTKIELKRNGMVIANVSFAVQGGLRDEFNESNWEKAYAEHDNTFKIKYTVRLYTGDIRKRTLGREINSYRKASIFWTRNPKLVNPMKNKRIWVQVAKNFEPFIALSVKGVQSELFDFNDKIIFDPAEIGTGTHEIKTDVSVSWQKHIYSEPESHKSSATASITIN